MSRFTNLTKPSTAKANVAYDGKPEQFIQGASYARKEEKKKVKSVIVYLFDAHHNALDDLAGLVPRASRSDVVRIAIEELCKLDKDQLAAMIENRRLKRWADV